jgi:hypothetical protein
MAQNPKPPVEEGDIVLLDMRDRTAWVPAKEVAELQADLDKCRSENKGWRSLFRRVQEALFGGKARKEDFDSEFPT